jgi:hypothetical protein
MKRMIIILIFLLILCSCSVSKTEIKPAVILVEDVVVEEKIIEDEVVNEILEEDEIIENEIPEDDVVDEKEVIVDKVEDETVKKDVDEEVIETEPVDEETVEDKVEEELPNKYPIHKNIMTTYFWIGEDASSDNSWISNHHSAWDELWVEHFGGIDDPDCREGYYPCGFIPKENPFYCALPYSDYDRDGLKANIDVVPWGKQVDATSVIKNRWIKIIFSGKEAYCQWEDAGPGSSDDIDYVFGDSSIEPIHSEQIGLDVSPAVRDYLGLDGMDETNWQFVDDEDVKEGPWMKIITYSDACWVYEGSSCE